jgi:flagellar biosynthesis GTPase FlhF
MPDHLKDGLVAHVTLLAESHKRQQEEIQAYQEEIKILNKIHREEIKALERRQEEKFKDLERRKEEEMKALERRQEEEMKALERRQEEKFKHLERRKEEEMKASEKKQEEEMKTMRGELDKLKQQTEYLKLNMRIFPIDFRVENPDRCKVINPWLSTPFYSHSQGYKLQIIFFNQPWFSIHCYLMRGEFDGLLKWPLKAEMKLALLNQQARGHDYEFNIKLECSKPLGDEALNAMKCGSCTLLGSIDLDPYLRSGCLHIRVVSIQF